MPFWPPKKRPMNMSSSVSAVSRNAVLNVFPMTTPNEYRCYAWGQDSTRDRARSGGRLIAGPSGRSWALLGQQTEGTGPHPRLLGLLGSPLERPLQSLIQRGLGLLVFRLRDTSLLMLHFQLKKFLFEGFEQHTGTSHRRGLGPTRSLRNFDFRSEVGDWRPAWPLGDVDRTRCQNHGEAAKNVPAIFFQRIGSVDRRAKSSAGTRVAAGNGCARACLATSSLTLISTFVQRAGA